MESNNNKNTETVKFLCSYGGKILPSYTDGTLRYADGLTRVLAVDRSISSQVCVLFRDFFILNHVSFEDLLNLHIITIFLCINFGNLQV